MNVNRSSKVAVLPHPKPYSRSISLNVTTVTGRVIEVDVGGSDSVRVVKERICEAEGIAVALMMLVFVGRQLGDEEILSDVGIQDQSSLKLVLKMSGGPPPPIISTKSVLEDQVVFLLCKQNQELYVLEVHLKDGARPKTVTKHHLRLQSPLQGQKLLNFLGSNECFDISDMCEFQEEEERPATAESIFSYISARPSSVASIDDAFNNLFWENEWLVSEDKALNMTKPQSMMNIRPATAIALMRLPPGQRQLVIIPKTRPASAEVWDSKKEAEFLFDDGFLTKLSKAAEESLSRPSSADIWAKKDAEYLFDDCFLTKLGEELGFDDDDSADDDLDDRSDTPLNFISNYAATTPSAIMTAGGASLSSFEGSIAETASIVTSNNSRFTSAVPVSTFKSSYSGRKSTTPSAVIVKVPLAAMGAVPTSIRAVTQNRVSTPLTKAALNRTSSSKQINSLQRSKSTKDTQAANPLSKDLLHFRSSSPLTRLPPKTPRKTTPIKFATQRCCSLCSRRLGPAQVFVCKCTQTFCATHRYEDRHGCDFDYKGRERERMGKENPVVKGERVIRL